MTTFDAALRRFMKSGSQTLSSVTGIPKTTIDSWLQGRVQRPRDWRPLLVIAQALLLTRDEADTLLLAAGHPSIAELAAQLTCDHPDRRALQPWLAANTHLPSARYQLRGPVGDFVGRKAEIDQLRALLCTADTGNTTAVVGVQGMGGIGKTELAYVVARELRSTFPDAQIVVPLRGVSPAPLAPEQALQTIIRVFIPDATLPDDLPTLESLYCAHLHERRVLILADDARDTTQVRPLLPPPGSALLVTSRTRFTLPGMTTIHLDLLPADDTSALLRMICPRLTADTAVALARACGYLPLALRIGAGMLQNDPALPVASYLARLANERERLAHLRDPDDPQLDVAATFAVSYDRLDALTQQVFRQLGVLVANFPTDLARMVVAVPAGEDIATVLSRLLRRNLVMYDPARGRWRLHNLVRDLARHYLTADEAMAVAWRYARAAIALARTIQDQYLTGGDSALAALAQFDAERPHIDMGRQWAADHAGTVPGDQLLRDVALATRHIGLLRYDAQHERIPHWEQALAAARRLGDQHAEGLALNHLGIAYAVLGDPQRAIPTFEQGVALACAIGDHCEEARLLCNLGNAYVYLDDPQRAIPTYQQALTLARMMGDHREEGRVLGNLGFAYVALGDIQQAIDACKHALTLARAIGDQRNEGYALSTLARAQALLGDYVSANATCTHAIALFQAVGDRWGEAECQWEVGLALAQRGELAHALPLLRAALAYEQEIGHTKATEHAAQLARLEKTLAVHQHPPALQRAIGARTDPL